MSRPAFVGEAISLDEQGVPYGTYSDFVLRSAYQPIYKTESNTTLKLHGFEGLLRVSLGDRPIDTQAFFESVLQEDRLFVEMMCTALHIRSYQCSQRLGETLFLNINAANFPSSEVAESEMFFTFSQLHKNGLDKTSVVFELHNGSVATPYVLTRLCELFRSNGFRFALDDFGVQHSSIERYILLRPNMIKINKDLFTDQNRFKQIESLMTSLVNVFRENGASVLVDCIETQEQLLGALQMEVSLLQGYHLGKPQLHPAQVEAEIVLADALKLPRLAVVGAR